MNISKRIFLAWIIVVAIAIPAVCFADAGYALQFAGSGPTGQYILIPGNQAFVFGTGDFTIEMWVNMSQQPQADPHRLLFSNSTYENFELTIGSAGEFSFVADYNNLRSGPLDWNLGRWYHVACTRSGGLVTFYRDGASFFSGSCPNSCGNLTDILIGYRRFNYNHPLNGIVDEVRVWNIARSQSEIQSTMRFSLQGNEPGLIGYWQLNEGQGQSVHDSSPNGINGSLGNSIGPNSDDPVWVLSTAPIITSRTCWYISTDGNDILGDGSIGNPLKTIQFGINISQNGDTVLVAPGTYYENINFNGRNIILASNYLTTEDTSFISSTVIDGNQVGRVIQFENGEESTATVIGFTVQNGTNSGINCYTSSPTIIYNIIKNNHAIHGGGINCYNYSHPLIWRNDILNNTAEGSGGGIACQIPAANPTIRENRIIGNTCVVNDGGGIFCEGLPSPSIEDNIISQNSSPVHGGGIFCLNSSAPLIKNNTISNNFAVGGAGISCHNSANPLIANNRISNNTCNSAGGGIETYDSTPLIEHNLIYDNTAPNGAGIYCRTYGPTNISNNTICGNSAGNKGGGICAEYGAVLNVKNTILWGNTSSTGNQLEVLYTGSFNVSYSDIQGGWTGTGNINLEPQFIGGSPFDYHLLSSSPCINTGDPASLFDPDGSRADMGAYPFNICSPELPVIIAPANNAVIDSSAWLTWHDPYPSNCGQVSFHIQIDNDSLFDSPEIDVDSLSRERIILDGSVSFKLSILDGYNNLLDNSAYCWRVRAENSAGAVSPWSSALTFIFNSINVAPNSPISGFSPANSEQVISLTPVITWNPALDPDTDDNVGTLRYGFRLSQDSLFAAFVYEDTTDLGIAQIQPSVELIDNSHYYYQVKTFDDGGLTSAWSAIQNFWTNHYNYPPEPFPLISPEPATRRVDYYTYFKWHNTIDNDPGSSFTFALQYSPDSLFRGYGQTIYGLSDTTMTVPTDSIAQFGNRIYWRVLAIDDDSLIRVGGIPEQFRKIIVVPVGDANGDGLVRGSDVTYLVSYFKGINPAPEPLLSGDVNGDCQLRGSDVTFLVRYFKGVGPDPVRAACEQPLILTKPKTE